ncbi:MAG: RagB/SusD family nutrient uptake outer membrane protein [Paludibacteraceae bacterium]|nr:RagB/SusD family nutrient uptake outer membrane protein [Paludibacteraceae bacterium]
MKRVSFIVLAVIAFGFSSCNFLNLTDPDAFDESKFYRDSADMEGLLASAYAGLRPAYDKLFFVTEMKSDNAYTTDMGTAGGKYYTFVSHTVTSQNDIVAEIYNAFYFCIHRSNLVLEHLDAVQMSEAERNRLRGEALYLRALSHFYLTRLWGKVTIMRHTITGSAAAAALRRSPVEDVYAFIIEDLKSVADANWLPATCTGAQFGHASRTAACALLGRVYLQQAATQNKPELYNDAVTYLEKAISVSGYAGLEKAYNKLFTLEEQNDAEVIFPIMYMANAAEGSNFAQYFQPQGATGLTSALTGRGFNIGQENLYLEFESTQNGFPTNDRIRTTAAIRKYTDGTYYTRKYVDLNPAGYGGNIWFEIRFADVYLMLAEAYERVEGNTSAKAIEYLDKVRSRPSSSLKDYATMQTNAAYVAAYPTLREAIFHERRVELCFENQRWFDLMRLYSNADDFVAYMRSVVEPNVGAKYTGFQKYELLLPIPYDEVFLNPDLGQNEGY